MTATPADRNDLENKRCRLVAIAARLMAAPTIEAATTQPARSKQVQKEHHSDQARRSRLLGGLDTSVAIGWIAEATGAEVVAVAVDVGQGGEDLEACGSVHWLAAR
jgi:hypothetical protein